MAKTVAILVAGAFLGALLLTLVFLLPVNIGNVTASQEILEKEGWYPAVPTVGYGAAAQGAGENNYVNSFLPGVLDNNTDRLMISIATNPVKGNFLYHAMNMYSSFQGFNYSRYWHGYVALLRPLLLVFDYSEIRVLNGVCQLGLVAVLAYLLGKRKGFPHVCALLTSYALLMPLALSLSFQYSWVFYIGVSGSILLLWKCEWLRRNNRYLYLFLLLGMLTSYMDLLTYPLFTWGFPMVWWLTVEERELSASVKLRRVVSCGLMWIVGYGGMWALKWLLGSLVLGRNLFTEAMGNVLGWSGIVSTYQGGIARRIGAVTTNWRHYAYPIWLLLLLCWLIYFAVRSCRRGWGRRSGTYAFLLTGSASLVWFFLIDNHTIEHHFFAYRNYSVAILALLVGMLELLERGEPRRGTAVGWGLLALAAGLLSCLSVGGSAASVREFVFHFVTWMAVGLAVLGLCLGGTGLRRRRKT